MPPDIVRSNPAAFANSAKSGEHHLRLPQATQPRSPTSRNLASFPRFATSPHPNCPNSSEKLPPQHLRPGETPRQPRGSSRLPAPYVETLQKLATSNHPKQHASRKVAYGRFLLPRKLFSRHLPLDCSRHLNSITLWSIGARGPHCRCRKRQLLGARNRPKKMLSGKPSDRQMRSYRAMAMTIKRCAIRINARGAPEYHAALTYPTIRLLRIQHK